MGMTLNRTIRVNAEQTPEIHFTTGSELDLSIVPHPNSQTDFSLVINTYDSCVSDVENPDPEAREGATVRKIGETRFDITFPDLDLLVTPMRIKSVRIASAKSEIALAFQNNEQSDIHWSEPVEPPIQYEFISEPYQPVLYDFENRTLTRNNLNLVLYYVGFQPDDTFYILFYNRGEYLDPKVNCAG